MNRHSREQAGRVAGSALLIVVAVIVSTGLYGIWHLRGGLDAPGALFDTAPPVVEWGRVPKGITANPQELSLRVSDTGSGLKRITVELIQGDKPQQLLNKGYGEAVVRVDEVTLPIDAAALKLVQGGVDLHVSVEDYGVWSRPTHLTRTFIVDLRTMRIEPVTVQHNVTVGGAELVVFRVQGREPEEVGVELAGRLYPAYPLRAFAPNVEVAPDLYAALFPIPTTFDVRSDTLQIVARDPFGTRVASAFNYRIAPRTFPEVEMKLGDQFVRAKVPELLLALRRAQPDVALSGDDVRDFRLINETLRTHNEATIQRALAASPVREKLWSGAFVRPLAAASKAGFAERRVYRYDGVEISRSEHVGVDLADLQRSRVGAAQSGEVVFVGELGIYGESVIIDHGVGVSTIYAHLSSISVKTGERVVSGQEIGRTGMTGLAGGDHLHYEVRVQGVPVSPFAWWDANWMRDHLEGKIAQVQGERAPAASSVSGDSR